MTTSPWLPLFRAIAAEVRSTLQPLVGTPRGRDVIGTGAGGDRTVYLDSVAEAIVVEHLERAYRSGRRFRLLSEELGGRDFGGDELILVDPLDGSVNAKHGLPYYAIVLAVADEARLAAVRCGYVQNLVSGEEFFAERGRGAYQNAVPLRRAAQAPGGSLSVIQLDAPAGPAAYDRARPLMAQAERVRQLGSAALNLCHTATGGISLQAAPLPVRAFDLAGPLLILTESGGIASDFEGGSLAGVGCDLEARSTLLASGYPLVHAAALRWLAGQAG